MKILKININNIHSLKGIQPEINFSEGILGNAGLYAITGQTGAGKSTILDAITLALYGKTNRHGNDKPSDEIITRNQKEAFSEVTFEVDNEVYLAKWNAAFTKTGSLRSDVRQLYKIQGDNFLLLADKVKDVDLKIEEIIGLKYEQFTKSILLAQNNFSAFLKAKPDERAEMLSKITGTQIYESISKKVFEQAKLLENEINILRSSINANFLSEEQLEKITADILEKDKTATIQKNQVETVIAEIAWLDAIDSVKKEIENKNIELQKINDHFKQNEEVYLKLADFNKAQLIETYLQAFQNAKTNCQNNSNTAIATGKDIQNLSEQLSITEPELKTASINLQAAKDELILKNPLIDQAKITINTISSNKEALNKITLQLTKTTEDNAVNEKNLASETQKKSALEQTISANEKVIVSLSKYESWDAEKGSVELLYRDIETLQSEINNTNIDQLQEQLSAYDQEKIGVENLIHKLHEEINKLTNDTASIEKQKNEFPSFEILSQTKEDLNKQLENWSKLAKYIETSAVEKENLKKVEEDLKKGKVQKENLEKLISEKKDLVKTLEENKTLKLLVASLEEHRHNLKDGDPCALCGSTEHPYALNLPKDLEENADDSKIEKISSELKGLTAEEVNCIKSISALGQQILTSKNNLPILEREINVLKTILKIDTPLTADFIQLNSDKTTRLLEKTEEQVANLSGLTSSLEVQTKLLSSKKDILNKVEMTHKDYQTALACILKNKASIKSNVEIIVEKFQQFGYTLDTQNLESVAIIHKQLTATCTLFNEEKEKLKANQNTLGELKTSLATLQTQDKNFKTEIESLKKEITRLTELEKTYSHQLHNQTETFILKSPVEEENRLQEIVNSGQDSVNQLTETFNTLLATIKSKKETLEKLTTEKTELDKKQETSKQNLQSKLSENNFESLEALTEALSLTDSESISTQKLKLDNSKQQTEGALKSSHDQLEVLLGNPLTAKSKDELTTYRTELDAISSALHQEIGQLKEQIENNRRIQNENKQIVENINSKTKDFEKWDLLNKTVGSSDGKAFKKFAQDFTLSLLIQHANKHLETMFRRYELFKDDNSEEMELQIKDNSFYDEIRNINSLSGGETFLVSLSLALGLSDLASKKTKIRSLFIDEGFGTLDPENLNNALDTLEMLRQTEDRQIGIISHIDELKKRVTTQIKVNKISNEYSSLEIVD